MTLFQIKTNSDVLCGVGIHADEKRPVVFKQWDVITFQANGRMYTTIGYFIPVVL